MTALPRVERVRTIGSGTAFPAPGVSQALARTERVPVVLGGATHWAPRPDLLGAIVLKATASTVDHADPERHRDDLAFLCGLVADPYAYAEVLTKKDRTRLRVARRKMPPDHGAWRCAGNPEDAMAALDILVGG